ncbi:MAG: 50S ribosomal protein L11 methyltransferase [Bacteroidetes bacterium]|nr:50S ribosomal protein L11 methyltransferase [Bacteroidota bacterium]
MNIAQFTFSVTKEQSEILVALLSDQFFGFSENPNELIGYADVEVENIDDEMAQHYIIQQNITFIRKEIENTDWNKTWEDSFEPVVVGNQVFIGAPHHQFPEVEYKIVIQPKMAFGTGHHPTTYLMAKNMLQLQIKNAKVLDFGAGTGVLAILAKQMGASLVEAIDNDLNCIHNMQTNFELNSCTEIEPILGDIDAAPKTCFNVLLANVTKNVNLERFESYAKLLEPEGLLLCSGFFTIDNEDLIEKAKQFNFNIISTGEKDNWSQLTFRHNN